MRRKECRGWNLLSVGQALIASAFLLLFSVGGASAQTGVHLMPGDVLNPDSRGNTPDLKVAVKLGINRASYTNDRFLDNRPFDVGIVFGEEDVYGSAAGFGFQGGIEVEIPRSTLFSWTVGLRYDHLNYSSSGRVTDICTSINGDSIAPSGQHSFAVNMDYLRLFGAAKLNFRDFYLVLGLTASTPLQHDVLFTRDHDGEPCFYPERNDIRNSRTPVEIPEASNIHFGLRFGGGLTWDMTERLQFSPELTLDFGMSAINKSPESDLGVYALNGVFRFAL